MTKRLIYRALCAILEKYHSVLDPCAFKKQNNGRCLHGIPCCHSGETCGNLSKSGCTIHSLSCLFWLCRDSLDYLNQIASNPSHELYLQAKSYLLIRPYLVRIAEYFIPLQPRSNEDSTFCHSCADWELRLIPHWYDDWDGLPWDDPNFASAAEAFDEDNVVLSFIG